MTDPSPHTDFRVWNEWMVQRHHPTKYHQSRNPIIRWIEGKRTRVILRALGIQQNNRVLDVGCGAGDILVRIPRGTLYGVDISPMLVEEARRRLGGRAEILCGDAEQVNRLFPGQQFDKIFCSEVLEHVLHPERVADAMVQLLCPGGSLVVSIPNERLINACKKILKSMGLFGLLFGGQVADRMEDEWHLHIFSRRKLLSLFARPTLTLQAVWGIPFRWFPLRFVVCFQKTKNVRGL